MSPSEAEQIDKSQNLLPGGSGEHDFNVLDTFESTSSRLTRFAEECGGLWDSCNTRKRGTLVTCDCGTYHIYFTPDGSRVSKVVQDTGFEYWNKDRARVRGIGYQECNAFEMTLEYYSEVAETLAL